MKTTDHRRAQMKAQRQTPLCRYKKRCYDRIRAEIGRVKRSDCEKLIGTNWEHAMSRLGDGWQEKQIDHIIPVREYDMSIESDRLKCFNYLNQQSLTKEEHDAKCTSIVPETQNMRALWPAAWWKTWVADKFTPILDF